MKDLLALMSPTRWAVFLGTLAVLVLAGTFFVSRATSQAREDGRNEVRAEHLAAQNRGMLIQAERIATLISANEEIQHAYNKATHELSVVELDRARTERVRDSERAAISAAAGRAASDSCGRYASAAERNLAGVEADATALGLRAAGASATAHALKRTLDEQAQAVKRFAMPQSPFKQEK